MLNKVIYSLGFAVLLYLAEEAGRKKGYRQAYKEISREAKENPDMTLDELINKDHHADDKKS